MLYKDQPPPDPPTSQPEKAVSSKPPRKDDELTQQLRTAIRRSRPWKKGRKVATWVTLALVAALLAWWFWPRPVPASVYVVAFDQLTVPDQLTPLRIATEPVDSKAEFWGKQEVFVEELKAQRVPGDEPKLVKLRTDATGLAVADWQFTSTPLFALIEARCPDVRTKRSDESRARVFVWPAQTPLLVVELTAETKTGDGYAAMAVALDKAQAAGWKVVYLATGPDRPRKYEDLRDWAHQQMAADHGEKLPAGPVLGRMSYYDDVNATKARDDVLAGFAKQFKGYVVFADATQNGLNVATVPCTRADCVVSLPRGAWQELERALKQVAPR
jgi:hypothetical protein